MEQKVYIDFALLDTKINPKMITKLIGIIPDNELSKGEKNPNLDIPRQNIWSLQSKINSEDILLHWEEIDRQLNHAKDTIKTILKDGFGCTTIVMLTETCIPKIIIPAKMSQFLGYIGAMIDIDHMQCPTAEGISVEITYMDQKKSIKKIISITNSSDLLDHWNEIKDKIDNINTDIFEIKKLELLIADNNCIPSIQIYPKLLNILGKMNIDITI